MFHFRCLNKASIITDGEVNPDGSPTNHWNLCSIQQIEELKCLIRIMPIWASGILCFIALSQQATFTVSQAPKMDRHLGPNFQIPPGSLSVISRLALTIFIPIYDRILVPMARRITKTARWDHPPPENGDWNGHVDFFDGDRGPC